MSRPRRDGSPPRRTVKRKFTDAFVASIKPDSQRVTIHYDTRQIGFAVATQTSGAKAWKCVYFAPGGRPRWFHIGRVGEIGLSDARKMAAGVMLAARSGKDPQAEKRAERSRGSFAELAVQYRTEYAKVHNKSWRQAARLVEHYAIPKIGGLPASGVTRSDIKAMLKSRAPVLANQILASTSAVFAFGVREGIVPVNPCALITRNPVNARERILSNDEVRSFWAEFGEAGSAGMALQMILLTAARPGEIGAMRSEHVVDGTWTMPGQPDGGWPGTKNKKSHAVWLSKPAQEIIANLGQGQIFSGVKLDAAMREINAKLGIKNRVRPHDLRRTSSSMVAGMFGMEAMDRVTNHAISGVRKTYNRFDFASKDREIMEWLGSHIVGLAEGTRNDDRVIVLRNRKRA
jgi:integrase